MVWAAGEAVQEQVQISAAKLQSGSYAVWMGMYAPVTQMRAVGEAGPGVVVDNRATVGVSAWARRDGYRAVLASPAAHCCASGAR